MKGNRAKGKSAEVRDINLALDNIKAQIIKHYLRIFDREAFVTAEMVSNAYQGIGSEYETLLKASGRENEVFKKRVGKDRVMATTVHGWWQETMWQRSSSLFTDGRICSCWRLSRLHQGVCSLPINESGTSQRDDMGKMHVAERRCHVCAL